MSSSYKGSRLVVAGTDCGDRYLAEQVGSLDMGHHPMTLPVVRLIRILRYPRQRAILYDDVINEVPPMPKGTICRMRILHYASEGEISCFASWEESERIWLDHMLIHAKDPKEQEIIMDHLAHTHHASRSVCVITDGDERKTPAEARADCAAAVPRLTALQEET